MTLSVCCGICSFMIASQIILGFCCPMDCTRVLMASKIILIGRRSDGLGLWFQNSSAIHISSCCQLVGKLGHDAPSSMSDTNVTSIIATLIALVVGALGVGPWFGSLMPGTEGLESLSSFFIYSATSGLISSLSRRRASFCSSGSSLSVADGGIEVS